MGRQQQRLHQFPLFVKKTCEILTIKPALQRVGAVDPAVAVNGILVVVLLAVAHAMYRLPEELLRRHQQREHEQHNHCHLIVHTENIVVRTNVLEFQERPKGHKQINHIFIIFSTTLFTILQSILEQKRKFFYPRILTRHVLSQKIINVNRKC